MEEELESVENHQGVPCLVSLTNQKLVSMSIDRSEESIYLVFPSQHIKEHLISLIFAVCYSSFNLLSRILAILSVVYFISLLHRSESVQLVHDTVGIGFDEGKLVLIVSRHLPSQMLQPSLDQSKYLVD